MLTLRIVFTIIIYFIIQAILPYYIKGFGFVDLALILVVYLGLQRDSYRAITAGAILGFIQDILSESKLLGASSFTKTIIGYFLFLLGSRLKLDEFLIKILVIIFSSIINTLIFVMLHYLFSVVPQGMTIGKALLNGSIQTIVNLILSFILFPLLDKFFREVPYDSARTGKLRRKLK